MSLRKTYRKKRHESKSYLDYLEESGYSEDEKAYSRSRFKGTTGMYGISNDILKDRERRRKEGTLKKSGDSWRSVRIDEEK